MRSPGGAPRRAARRTAGGRASALAEARNEEVKRHWLALPLDVRLSALRFQDRALVERAHQIQQTLHGSELACYHQGIISQFNDAGQAVVSTGLRHFVFEWEDTEDGSVVLADPNGGGNPPGEKRGVQPQPTVLSATRELVERGDFFPYLELRLGGFLQGGAPMLRHQGLVSAFELEPNTWTDYERQIFRLVEFVLFQLWQDASAAAAAPELGAPGAGAGAAAGGAATALELELEREEAAAAAAAERLARRRARRKVAAKQRKEAEEAKEEQRSRDATAEVEEELEQEEAEALRARPGEAREREEAAEPREAAEEVREVAGAEEAVAEQAEEAASPEEAAAIPAGLAPTDAAAVPAEAAAAAAATSLRGLAIERQPSAELAEPGAPSKHSPSCASCTSGSCASSSSTRCGSSASSTLLHSRNPSLLSEAAPSEGEASEVGSQAPEAAHRSPAPRVTSGCPAKVVPPLKDGRAWVSNGLSGSATEWRLVPVAKPAEAGNAAAEACAWVKHTFFHVEDEEEAAVGGGFLSRQRARSCGLPSAGVASR